MNLFFPKSQGWFDLVLLDDLWRDDTTAIIPPNQPLFNMAVLRRFKKMIENRSKALVHLLGETTSWWASRASLPSRQSTHPADFYTFNSRPHRNRCEKYKMSVIFLKMLRSCRYQNGILLVLKTVRAETLQGVGVYRCFKTFVRSVCAARSSLQRRKLR